MMDLLVENNNLGTQWRHIRELEDARREYAREHLRISVITEHCEFRLIWISLSEPQYRD